MDGLKTGYTEKAGFCLTATAKRGDLRFLTVVMGETSSDQRSTDTAGMMSYGFGTFKLNTVMTTEEELGKVKIEQGKEEYGTLVLVENDVELMKVDETVEDYTFNIKVNNKIVAPIKNGDVVGSIEVIDNEGNIIRENDLTIKEDIKKASIWNLFVRNLKTIITGKSVVK